jgi:hypothetical protein
VRLRVLFANAGGKFFAYGSMLCHENTRSILCDELFRLSTEMTIDRRLYGIVAASAVSAVVCHDQRGAFLRISVTDSDYRLRGFPQAGLPLVAVVDWKRGRETVEDSRDR